MNLINIVLGTPLGFFLRLFYGLTSNYGLAIILFTLLSRAVFFPASLLAQKNAIIMAKIKPRADALKKYYSGDKERIDEERLKLYKEERYNPFLGCLPMVLQVLLVIGLINVMYNPLRHILGLPRDVIDLLTAASAAIEGVQSLGIGAHLATIEAVQSGANAAAFAALGGQIPDIYYVLDAIQGLNIEFMGINLGMVPPLRFSALATVPLLASLSAFVMCLIQSKVNILQRVQSARYNWGMTAFFTLFSLYFAFTVPAGVGIFWIFANVFSIGIMLITNLIYNPKKYIDFDSLPKPAVVDKPLQKALNERSKADAKRFNETENKRLVFYSVKNGAYKYYKNVLDCVFANSDITVHYITSDPDDVILQTDNPRIKPYFMNERKLISVFMKMDADMVVMTTPDLQKYHVKRSIVRKDVEYVYIFHNAGSTHMLYREGAFDHFDTIFCTGPHQIREIRKRENMCSLREKKLIECGYGLIDELLVNYESMEKTADGASKPRILIGPSWQKDNILESCLDELLTRLLGRGYHIMIRPHPEYIKRFPEKMNAVLDQYKDMTNENFRFDLDFSSSISVFTADIVISDWSGVAVEYSFATKRPCLYINTPMKVLNQDYEILKLPPVEISLRDNTGVTLDLDKLDLVGETVEGLLRSSNDYREKIAETLENTVFNIGRGGFAGGMYIVETLKSLKDKKLTNGD